MIYESMTTLSICDVENFAPHSMAVNESSVRAPRCCCFFLFLYNHRTIGLLGYRDRGFCASFRRALELRFACVLLVSFCVMRWVKLFRKRVCACIVFLSHAVQTFIVFVSLNIVFLCLIHWVAQRIITP